MLSLWGPFGGSLEHCLVSGEGGGVTEKGVLEPKINRFECVKVHVTNGKAQSISVLVFKCVKSQTVLPESIYQNDLVLTMFFLLNNRLLNFFLVQPIMLLF